MTEPKNSYKDIVKSTAMFGGVQVVQILSTILRGKFVALILGTTGIGINALINSAITLVTQFASLGINFSAVRDISQANTIGDSQKLGATVFVFKRWMYSCAFMGAAIMIIFSKKLSLFSFGNNDYQKAFMFSSMAVALTILSSANITILQGKQRLNTMAKVSLWSAVLGLVFSLPCYFFWRLNGIVPALICSAVISLFLSSYFSRGNFALPKFSLKETFNKGTTMAKLGVTMMIATLIGSCVNYCINAYVGSHGSIAEVGLYSAGNSITNQYIGVVFTAMAVDYFPKLSAVSADRQAVNKIVNAQSEIVILISAPILIIMILSAPLIIKILLSNQFIAVTGFVYWAAFAMLFKAASFAVGYISFAKGDKKTFFLLEGIFGNLLILFSNIIGYRLGGITGVAKGILISYIIYMLVVNIAANRIYGFKLENGFLIMFIKIGLLLAATLFCMLEMSKKAGYLLGFALLFITVFYCFRELNRRIHIGAFLSSKFKKAK